MEIKPLGQESISRIVAEQAITDLSSIVKELVDNALDADSTTINIRLFDQGLRAVEVSDDGTGVPPACRPAIATRYATSKISSFEDIYSGTGLTMGFRGEALFSMACLCEKLHVITRTAEEEMAQKMTFRRDGSLDPESIEPYHRKVGTTVAVQGPFAALPARRADLERRIRTERTKLFRLIEAYSIFNIGIQFSLMDSGTRESVALATSMSSTTLEETVSAVLGFQVLSSLTRIQLDFKEMLQKHKHKRRRRQQKLDPDSDGEENGNDAYDDDDLYDWKLEGLISKSPRAPQPQRAVHYYSINGRVVELPKITALMRKLWGGFGGKKKPSSILTLTLPNDSFDINLSPDKQQVLLAHEQEICEMLQEAVSKLWASHTDGVFQTQTIDFLTQEENERDDGDDGARQMHKRRFAFVHDLSQAKMQHDLDGRKVTDADEEKKEANEEKEPNCCETTLSAESETKQQSEIPTEQEPPTKKAKVVSREELNASSAEEQESARPNIRRSLRSREVIEDKISDLDRRQWTEIQSKFKRVESDEMPLPRQPHTSPVTPDGLTPTLNTSSVANPTEKRNPSRRSRTVLPSEKTSTKGTTDFLQQFAFRASSSNDRKGEPVEKNKSKASPRTTQSVPKLPTAELRNARKRLHAEVETDNPSEEALKESIPETKARAREPSRDTFCKSEDLVEKTSCTDSMVIDSSKTEEDKSESCHKPKATDNEDPNDPDETGGKQSCLEEQPVVWESFNTIDDACRAARMQRRQMRRRKVELSQIGKITSDQHVDEDAKEVVNSVGEVSPAKGTNSVINLTKSTFRDGMEVIGQFNMGFILAQDKNKHIWILDQHSCDEKYNFENLCKNTVIREQKLIRPMPLDLTPPEEACILDHMEIFEANGFRFEFKPEAPVRHRFFLTALPHSGAEDRRKAVQFGKDDVSALCSILSDGCSYDAGQGGIGTEGNGKYGNNAIRRYARTVSSSQGDSANRIVARLPKAIAMFASRACRSSIMIGTSLSEKEMDKLVKKMADVEHPWNCPHGRPTMRHVGEVLPVLQDDERRAIDHYSGPTVSITPMTQDPLTQESDH